ncbi:MAG: DJ-1/PfpI family protein [Lachnospiraceae bacterium]|nr:DJ-1/PfpI family protein [Lachnospiraceae bacterium]
MAHVGIFMADGCEEIEGLTVVDILRRAGIDIDMISVMDNGFATGSHGIRFECDCSLSEADFSKYDGLVLPGGMPGTTHLGENAVVVKEIKAFCEAGKLVSAICAAPSVLGDNGILQGKKATCHPGFEERLVGAEVVEDVVAVDGNVITSRGMGTAIPFALAIVEYFKDAQTATEIRKGIVY